MELFSTSGETLSLSFKAVVLSEWVLCSGSVRPCPVSAANSVQASRTTNFERRLGPALLLLASKPCGRIRPSFRVLLMKSYLSQAIAVATIHKPPQPSRLTGTTHGHGIPNTTDYRITKSVATRLTATYLLPLLD